MAPATKFTKIWRLKNVGECPWPDGTRILFVGGDQMSSKESMAIVASGRVMPGDEVDVALDLIAPGEFGRYVGYWRLAGPFCQRKFGQRIWCHIHVVDPCATVEPPSEQEIAEALEKQAELRKMNADAADEDGEAGEDEDVAEDKQYEEALQPLADKPSDAAAAQEASQPTVPMPPDNDDADAALADGANSEDSFVEVDEVVHGPEPQDISATVDALNAMGFTDDETVRLVIERNHGELEACARDMAALSEWEHMLDDLDEMGFEDRALNKEVLLRNEGSLKGAVKELHRASA